MALARGEAKEGESVYVFVWKWIDFQSIYMNDYSAFIKCCRTEACNDSVLYIIYIWVETFSNEVGNIMHIN